MATGTNAAQPPFTQARELYAELFEAENLETAMWHFKEMKPSEQRFIQAHLLYLLLHGQAVTNLNLRDIRVRISELERDLEQEEEMDEDEVEAEEPGVTPARLQEGEQLEIDDEEDEADEADEPDSAEAGSQRDVELPPQLQAAVGALEEALTYDREDRAATASEGR